MKIVYVFLSLFFLQNIIIAQETQKIYSTTYTDKSIKIDGYLNEEVWQHASIANEFIQTVPSPDNPSLYNTEVKIIYSKTAIYIGAMLYQPNSILLKQLTARDELNRVNADVFSVFLDTYHDQQNGYAFRVSAAGVQQDEKISSGGEYGDVSWDAVWKSKVSLHADKWIVEMEIPYSAIRFSKLQNQTWGVNFGRLVRKVNESSYWTKINVQQQGFLTQAGLLQGLQNLHPPVRLFLYPYVSVGYTQQPTATTTETHFTKSGGVDIKYGINESFTIDATLIPDFSQVVSDNLVRNLSPFEQQLTENRPFFTEGTELFNKAGIFYTRRLGGKPNGYYEIENTYSDTSKYSIEKNPNVTTLLNAIKFSGRNKKNIGIGIFNAIGAPMNASIFDKQTQSTFKINTEPLANYNVLVIDKPLKGQSVLSFTNTNVLKQGTMQDANVSAMQWTQFLKNESHAFSIITRLSTLHDTLYNVGTATNAAFAKTKGKFRYNIESELISPNYNQRNLGIQFNYNQVSQIVSLSYYENKPKLSVLQAYKISNNYFAHFNYLPFAFKDFKTTFNYFLLFKNFWDVTYEMETSPITPVDFYQLGYYNKRLKTNPYCWNGIFGSSDSRKKLFWNYYVGYGFSNFNKSGYFYAEQGLRYLLKNKIEFSVNGKITRHDGNIGFAYYDDVLQEPIIGKRFVREYDGTFSVKYNYSPTINFTARFRHYNSFISYQSFYKTNEKGEWNNNLLPYTNGYDENFNLQNVDVFFNWMFKPGSRLIVSYKQWLQDAYLLNNQQDNHYFTNVSQIIKTQKPFEVAVRLIYFLDYNELKSQHKKIRNY